MTITAQRRVARTGHAVARRRPSVARVHPAAPGGVVPRMSSPVRTSVPIDLVAPSRVSHATDESGLSERTLGVMVISFIASLVIGCSVAVGVIVSDDVPADSTHIVAVR